MKESSWLFRVASLPRHGGGHLARCTALAAAVRAHSPVTFVLDDVDDGAQLAAKALGQNGYKSVEAAKAGSIPILGTVIDGYEFTDETAAFYAARGPLVAFDDFLRPPASADLVINASCHLSGETVAGVPALLGPNYALINEIFSAIPDRDRTAPVQRILVTFGKLDPGDATGLVLESLDRLIMKVPKFDVTVIAPQNAEGKPWFKRRDITILSAVPNLIELTRTADLVIGAAGVSLFERMAAGVPSVTLSIVDNQDLFVAGAAAAGGTVNGGSVNQVTTSSLSEKIEVLLSNPDLRMEMSRSARKLIDGKGANRIAAVMRDLVKSKSSKTDLPIAAKV